jgi:hypothetical protein
MVTGGRNVTGEQVVAADRVPLDWLKEGERLVNSDNETMQRRSLHAVLG